MKTVCLVPVKNERWILQTFLDAAATWADHIIVLDQGSTDGSREIASQSKKVVLLTNDHASLDEEYRQVRLLAAARAIGGNNLLVPLDADEVLTARFWPKYAQVMRTLGPGSCLRADGVNVCEGNKKGWKRPGKMLAGWVDDGREHRSSVIHAERLPVRPDDRAISADPDDAVLHLQYLAVRRMRSKHRWYACWERVHRAHRHAIDVYREYHHMDSSRRGVFSLSARWFQELAEEGVRLDRVRDDGFHWWNEKVLDWIDELGNGHFRRQSIWDYDWVEEAKRGGKSRPQRFADPRTPVDRFVHRWLACTQKRYPNLIARAGDRVIKQLIWR